MLMTDEDALLCDLAETYGIFDIEAFKPLKIATFAIGLKGDSRIMLKMTGQNVDSKTILLASILDRLSFLAWTKTKDAQSGRNRPESVLNRLLNGNNNAQKDFEIYDTGEELLKRLDELRGA